tara:strand:- start:567 stop:884 length:318 start_codon:yes stop_codon:yes gene_type:complete
MRILKLTTKKRLIRFDKFEINKIMEIYSRKISSGEWKDYSICFKSNYALFCIHKSSFTEPTFEIMKNKSTKPIFSLWSCSKLIIKSDSLSKILVYFQKPKLTLIN